MPATTFAALVQELLRADGSRPLVTFYDDATGERVELSVVTYANWVAKTAGLVQDELGLERGDRVHVDLPTHWLTPVWLGAAWTVGLVEVGDRAAGGADLVVCGPAGVASVRRERGATSSRCRCCRWGRASATRSPTASSTTARWCGGSPTRSSRSTRPVPTTWPGAARSTADPGRLVAAAGPDPRTDRLLTDLSPATDAGPPLPPRAARRRRRHRLGGEPRPRRLGAPRRHRARTPIRLGEVTPPRATADESVGGVSRPGRSWSKPGPMRRRGPKPSPLRGIR